MEALLVLAVVAGTAGAQHVRFRVTSDTEDTPVPGAQVVSLNDRALQRTDDDGIVDISVVHPGANVFTVRHIGLTPITVTLQVPGKGTLAVHVIMHPAPQVLDTVSVRARARELQLSTFDRRRMDNVGGHFITWADIELRRPRVTIDLFREVPGLQVINVNGHAAVTSTRGLGVNGASCRPRVGFDGMVLSSDFDVSDILPSEIYGIEVYDGAATVPGQYLSSVAGSSCGLIMIWTLDGARQSAKRPR